MLFCFPQHALRHLPRGVSLLGTQFYKSHTKCQFLFLLQYYKTKLELAVMLLLPCVAGLSLICTWLKENKYSWSYCPRIPSFICVMFQALRLVSLKCSCFLTILFWLSSTFIDYPEQLSPRHDPSTLLNFEQGHIFIQQTFNTSCKVDIVVGRLYDRRIGQKRKGMEDNIKCPYL